MLALPAIAEANGFKTITTDGSPHDSFVWATLAANRVISISDAAPPGIREQAHAFREQIRQVVSHYVTQAVKDRFAHLAAELDKAGMREAAALIRSKET